MSKKKHKGDHGRRHELRAAQRSTPAAATAERPNRVYLRNSVYIFLTFLCILGSLGVLIGFYFLGLWVNPIGSILSVLLGAFACMCAYDIALLFNACMSFGEGTVNAGKDESGALMVFHANAVARLELRDKTGRTLPEGERVYKNVDITFVMHSGRVNRRHVSRLTAKQFQAIKAAWEAER